MKPSVLLLLVLPALSSVRPQDTGNNSEHRHVSILSPAPDDRIIEIFSYRTKLTHPFLLCSPTLGRKRQKRQKRQAHSPTFMFEDNSNLKWQTWNGSLPDGSVSIYNEYVDRTDYVCKYNCEAGFYNPDMGPYCHYPYGNKEFRSNTFEILVNKNNFEMLEWKDGSYGSVPKHSVKTCPKGGVYVGKNTYGLGKVHAKHEAFFLPWKGDEYWYKNYQVLTYNDDVSSQHISKVKYNIDEAKIIQYPPQTMRTFSITNHECNSVFKKVTLSKTDRVENRWDIGSSIMVGIKTTFTVGVPGISSGSIEISGEVSFQFSEGHTVTEEDSHSITLERTIPPKHYCKVSMVGYKYKADIPFTASLSRTYSTGETTYTPISGTYNSIQIGEVRAVVDQCELIPHAKPCPQRTP